MGTQKKINCETGGELKGDATEVKLVFSCNTEESETVPPTHRPSHGEHRIGERKGCGLRSSACGRGLGCNLRAQPSPVSFYFSVQRYLALLRWLHKGLVGAE